MTPHYLFLRSPCIWYLVANSLRVVYSSNCTQQQQQSCSQLIASNDLFSMSPLSPGSPRQLIQHVVVLIPICVAGVLLVCCLLPPGVAEPLHQLFLSFSHRTISAGFTNPSQCGTWGRDFRTMRGGIDPGLHHFRTRNFCGAVEMRKFFFTGRCPYPPRVCFSCL